MADPEGEEGTLQGLLENDGNPSIDWRDAQSNINGKLDALVGNIIHGFSLLGELLTGLIQGGKRSRQKSSSSDLTSSDSEHEDNPKRAKRIADDQQNDKPKWAKLADDQHDDVAALLGASEPQGKSDDDRAFGEILDSVVQDLNEEQFGPGVSEQLANVVNKTLRSKLTKDKFNRKAKCLSQTTKL